MNTISNRRAIITIIGIIAVAAFVYWFLQKPSPSGEETTPTATTTGDTTTTPAKPGSPTTSKPATKTTTTKVTTPSMTKDGLYIVSYTNKGFIPATLQIKRGRGVHFINNSDKAMRIFADLKNDKIYGEFNQSKTVGKGGTYDFTFNTSGNWAYHNENNPLDRGTIVVTEN